MKLSTKCRYGARAMLEIARNHAIGISTKRKDITANQGIPSSYLENILIDLRDYGLVTTIRGPKGGFRLSRAPEQITMYDIIHALRGTDALNAECLEEGYDCAKKGSCITRQVWSAMQNAQDQVLLGITLKTLIHSDGSGLDKLEYVI
jgi:Rrf2 family protein